MDELSKRIDDITSNIEELAAKKELETLQIEEIKKFTTEIRSKNPKTLWNVGRIMQMVILKEEASKYNQKTIFLFYKEAAQQGFAPAIRSLGQCYLIGLGVNRNVQIGLKYCEQAATLGNNMALFDLGAIYYLGDGVKKDIKKAFTYFDEIIENGDDETVSLVCAFFMSIREKQIAFDSMLKSAERGSTQAIYELAQMYNYGVGAKKNKKKAWALYLEAAQKDNAQAQMEVAWRYLYGEYVKKDISAGLKWLKISAENGNSDAECLYGGFLLDGEEVDRDIDKGFQYITNAALNENRGAQLALSKIYRKNDLGINIDHKGAFYWARKAAEDQGIDELKNLADFYFQGIGTEVDNEKGNEILKLCAEQKSMD